MKKNFRSKVVSFLLSVTLTIPSISGQIVFAAETNSVTYKAGSDHTTATVTATSCSTLPESTAVTLTATSAFSYTGLGSVDAYTFNSATEDMIAQYNSVETLLKDKFEGDLTGNVEVVDIKATGSDGETVVFPEDTVYTVESDAMMLSENLKAYIYDGTKLEETEVTYKAADTANNVYYPYASVTVASLQPIVLVNMAKVTEKESGSSSVTYKAGSDHTTATVTATSCSALPESTAVTLTATSAFSYTGLGTVDAYTFNSATEDMIAQYNSVETLLKDKFEGDLTGSVEVVDIKATGSDGETVVFPEDTVYTVESDAMMLSENLKAYIYDGTKLEETEVTYKAADTANNVYYPYASVTVASLQPIVLVNMANVTEKDHSDDGLKPGIYTITANLYVDGEDNVVLKGATAYLTNLNLPPLEPVKNNATLKVTEDHQVLLTIRNLNGIFTLQDIKDIEGKVEIQEKIMEEVDLGAYSSRISGLVLNLKDLSGSYKFEDCTEYPTILEVDKHMPICLSVDFDSMQETFDEDATDITSKEFSFTDGKAAINTSESAVASAVENAQFSVEDAENIQSLKAAVKELYSEDKKYKVYNPKVTNTDGEVSLTGNSQIAYTIQTDYEDAKVFVLKDGELDELSSVSLNGQIVFSDTKIEPFVIIDKASSDKWVSIKYESDDISYGYYVFTGGGFTENSFSGDRALEPRIEETENGTAYYIGFHEPLGDQAFSTYLSEWADLRVTIPYDAESGKKIYLVRQVNEKLSKNAEITGSYDTVVAIDLDKAEIADGKITFNLLEKNVSSSPYGGAVMEALYNGLENIVDGYGTAYILVSDKNIAGMPERYKAEDGSAHDLPYTGQTISLQTGSHYKVTEGTDSEVEAGEYSCTSVPEDGYTWLDGTTNPVTIKWKIEKQNLTCEYTNETIKLGQNPKAEITYKGFMNGETLETAKDFVAPTVTLPDTLEAGKEYTVNLTGGSAANYNLICWGGTLKVAEDRTYTSLSGTNRYATATAIAKEAYPDGAETVILVKGNDFPDALAANSYAGVLNAPILLTGTDKLNDNVKDLLNGDWKGKVDKVIILGDGMSSSVISSLVNDCDVSVRKIAGKNRYETALKIAKATVKVQKTDTVIVATGLKAADATSASSWSYANGYPILLADKNGNLNQESIDFIKNNGIEHVILLGDEKVVSDDCSCGLDSVRLGGINRYETSLKIAEYFAANTEGSVTDNVGFAHGGDEHFPDALVGGQLMAQYNAAIILTNETNTVVPSYIEENIAGDSSEGSTFYFLGYAGKGKSSVYEDVIESIESKD